MSSLSIAARYSGTCWLTGRRFPAGARIARVNQRWALADDATRGIVAAASRPDALYVEADHRPEAGAGEVVRLGEIDDRLGSPDRWVRVLSIGYLPPDEESDLFWARHPVVAVPASDDEVRQAVGARRLARERAEAERLELLATKPEFAAEWLWKQDGWKRVGETHDLPDAGLDSQQGWTACNPRSATWSMQQVRVDRERRVIQRRHQIWVDMRIYHYDERPICQEAELALRALMATQHPL